MTSIQLVITFFAAVAATVLTRFLPYVLFPEGREVPGFVRFLGRRLAPAVFGLLVVYCFRNTSVLTGNHGGPEFISLLVVTVLFLWRRGMVVPMLGGTVCYMLLLRSALF